jgi:hypothetical protein
MLTPGYIVRVKTATIQRNVVSNRRDRKENNFQRIEKPNGLDQLGSSIRGKACSVCEEFCGSNSQKGKMILCVELNGFGICY